jgi:hypothetical protein
MLRLIKVLLKVVTSLAEHVLDQDERNAIHANYLLITSSIMINQKVAFVILDIMKQSKRVQVLMFLFC